VLRPIASLAVYISIAFCLAAPDRAADQPAAPAASPPPAELWLYYPTNLLVDANLDKAKDLWSRAAKAGYTHVLLVDSKFARLGAMDKRYFANVDKVKRLAADLKLTLVPALFDVGYSNNLLSNDPNLAEGLPVKNQPFVVKAGTAEPAASPSVAFEAKPNFHDDVVSVDGKLATVSPGGKKGSTARMNYKLAVSPYRCYHVSVQVRTDGYKGQPEVKALAGKRSLQWQSIKVKPTQDWTTYDVVFNSLEHAEVAVYFGDWSYPGEGTMAWRNWAIEEATLVNVLRRPGTPFTVNTEDGRTLEEGKDFEPVVDPKMGRVPYAGEYKAWHAPAVLKTKSLPDGTKLLVSWYHPAIVYDGQVSGCCQDEAFRGLLADQAKRMTALFGADSGTGAGGEAGPTGGGAGPTGGGAGSAGGYMMSHDEFRTFGWDEPCRQSGKTPGQLLADNARYCAGLLKPAKAYVWNDMFDPFHNAVEGPYYLVNGSWAGSWEGLPAEVTIVNWNFGKRDQSLKFFADRGHRQVIAGYYDASPATMAAKTKQWLASAAKVPGVVGVMYTTWRNDYAQMEAFAAAVKGK
jgi:hypothetical protein